MPFCSAAAVFGLSSIEMLAVVSSKRTPLTMVLPLVMTPDETVLVGPLGEPAPPDPPPPPPPQAARTEAASAARSAVRNDSRGEEGERVCMIPSPIGVPRRRRKFLLRPRQSYQSGY